MLVSPGRCLAGVVIAAAALAAQHATAETRAMPGYAEVTIPDDAGAIAIIPRPDAARTLQGYAIETLSGSNHAAAEASPLRAALPSGPPVFVVVRFDPHRAGSAARASEIATALRRQGVGVSTVTAAIASASDEVGVAFVEDEATAASVVRHLPEPLPHITPVRLDARDLADPAPGTVEISLGGERRTS